MAGRPNRPIAFAVLTWLGTAMVVSAAGELKVTRVDDGSGPSGKFLTDKLALTEESKWGQAQVLLQTWAGRLSDPAVPRTLPKGALPHFSWDNRFTGYWHLTEDGRQIVTAVDELGSPIFQVTLPCFSTFETLGSQGLVILPEGSDDVLHPFLDLEFLNSAGSKVAVLRRPDQVILHRTVNASGELGLIVGDPNAQSDCRFLRVSAAGQIMREFVLDGVAGAGSTTGMSLSAGHASFVALPGTGGKPMPNPARRLLYLALEKGDPVIQDIGLSCGTRTVLLDEDHVALIGGRVIRVWDIKTNAWALTDKSVPGETFLSEAALLDGSLVTLSRSGESVHIIGVDMKTGAIKLDFALPSETELDQTRRALFAGVEGVRVVGKNVQFLVEKEGGR